MSTTMNSAIKLTLAITFALTVSGEFPNHKIVLKTLQQAQFECKQYLQIPQNIEAACEPRCEQILLRSWTDCHGLLSIPYGRHFAPDPNDADFLRRTQLCLDTALEDVLEEECCCQSSLAWQCYRDQFGNPTRVPQLAPMPDILVRSTVEDCAKLLQINDLELYLYARARFDVNDKSRSLLRCVLIRQGLYSDVSGPDLDRMFVQCGGYQVDAQKCVELLRSECSDNATLATRIVNYCFPPGSGPGELILVNTLAPTVGFLVGSAAGLVSSLNVLDPVLRPLIPALVDLPHALNPEHDQIPY